MRKRCERLDGSPLRAGSSGCRCAGCWADSARLELHFPLSLSLPAPRIDHGQLDVVRARFQVAKLDLALPPGGHAVHFILEVDDQSLGLGRVLLRYSLLRDLQSSPGKKKTKDKKKKQNKTTLHTQHYI